MALSEFNQIYILLPIFIYNDLLKYNFTQECYVMVLKHFKKLLE